MKRLLFTIISLCVLNISFAQDCYNSTRSRGIQLYNQKKYDNAIKSFKTAKSCPDKPKSGDDLDKWIAECEKAKAQKTEKTTTEKVTQHKTASYLRLDGDDSEKSYSFVAKGDTKQKVSVDCSESYRISEMPSWCHTQDQKSSGFTLLCDENTSSSPRTGLFTVTGGGKSVQVRVRQSGITKQAIIPSVDIKSIRVEQDKTLSDGKGLEIHVAFDIKNMNGKECRMIAYFYDSEGNAIIDTNETKYGTVGDVSYVATGTNFTPGYDNTTYSDMTLSIPYDELHQTGASVKHLKFKLGIWDKSISPSEQVYSGTTYTYFDYSTEVTLSVDGSTANKLQKFSATGGRITFIVNTNADSYDTWGIPSWCRVEDKTSTGFTLVCEANPYSTPRTDYMKVMVGGKEIRIDVEQTGAVNGATYTPTYHRKKFNSPSPDYKLAGLSIGYVSKQWVYKVGGQQEKFGMWDDSKSMSGLQIGFRIEPQWNYGFGLNTGLFYELYYTKTDELDSDNGYMEASVMEHSLYLPVHLEYRLHFAKSFQIFFYGGIGLDYGLGGTVKIKDPSGYYEDWESSDLYSGDNFSNWKRFNASLEYGAGFRAGPLQFQVSMAKGLINMAEDDDYDVFQNKNLTASMSIMF